MADCSQGREQGGGSAGLYMTISALSICNDSTGCERNTKILDLCVILHWGQMSSLVLYTVNAISVPNPNDSPHPTLSPLPSAANGTDGWKKRIAIFKKQKKHSTLLFLHFFCVRTLPSFQEKSIQYQSVNRFPAVSSIQGEVVLAPGKHLASLCSPAAPRGPVARESSLVPWGEGWRRLAAQTKS